MRPSIAPGIRVVRGPNWIWKNQDDGEGHVGTVYEIGRPKSINSPENTVFVNWDSGHRTNYRVGYQNQYDLIIVDNAQIGVRHSNVICDKCNTSVAGIVFKCAQCPNFHLCSFCYGADFHDLEHPFIRLTTPTSVGVRVPPRKGAQKIQLRGIFVKAKVIRGPDWEWDQQDGGEGKIGEVMEIRGWDNETCRSVASVTWETGSTNVYRLGHKGNVDLKYVTASFGGFYYKDHMPVLGQPEEQQPIAPAVKPVLSVGDRVKVCIEAEALIKLQQGHGGWNPRMVEQLGKLGTVHRITDKGDIRVQYDNCSTRWTFHPAALTKVISFRVGDLVTIINDAAKVQELQKGHGEWVDQMRNSLGKICKVVKVYSDGDLRIQQLDDGLEWTLNPKCVKLERSPLASAAERSNSMMDLSHRRTDHVMTPLSGLSGTSLADKLVRGAAQGRLDFVKQYLDLNPGQVDVMSGGKACIQVASHQGHVELVKYLISKGANVNIVDKEGDSALHYAAFGNQLETMRILLQNGADIDFLNASHCTALHICAHKKTPHCVRELLKYNADVNIQDSYGDTALHDAIGKDNTEVVEMLCAAPNLDFTLKNNRGFNVLQHASLKGNVIATRRILQRSRQLVNVRKDDGFAALHLAALNGHANVAETLVTEGQADINLRNNRRQTPFLLAVSQGNAGVVERLVNLGCDINVKDEDGDNAMHLCIIKKSNLQQAGEPSNEEAPETKACYLALTASHPHIKEDRLMYSMLIYLARKGCRIEPNNKGASIMEMLTDRSMKQMIIAQQIPAHEQTSSVAQLQTEGSAAIGAMAALKRNIQTLNVNDVGSGDGAVGNTLNNSGEVTASTSASATLASGISFTTPPPPTQRQSLLQLDVSSTMDDSLATCSSPSTKKLNSDNLTQGSNASPQIAPRKKITKPNTLFTTSPTLSEAATGSAGIVNAVFHVGPQECIVCNDVLQLVKFDPCQHQIACEDCCLRMKKCLRCGIAIERRLDSNGRVLTTNSEQVRVPSADRLRYLESKIQEYEESHYCSICMERTRDVAFLCGHGACSRCAETLRTCHMCRKQILRKINLY